MTQSDFLFVLEATIHPIEHAAKLQKWLFLRHAISKQTPTLFLRLPISARIGHIIQELERFALAVFPSSALTSHGRHCNLMHE